MNDKHALTTAESPWWAKLIDRFGVSTALLAVVLYGCWAASYWIAEHVVQPAVAAHLRQLAATEKAIEAQTGVLEDIKTTNRQHLVTSQSILRVVEENNGMIQDLQKPE